MYTGGTIDDNCIEQRLVISFSNSILKSLFFFFFFSHFHSTLLNVFDIEHINA